MSAHHLTLDKIKDLHILLSHQCNIRCKMCFQNEYSQKLSALVWKDKLAELYPSLEKIIIQGGEPTIIKEVKELIDLVISINPGIKISFMTNGLEFKNEWQNLFVIHGDHVNFSLNAAKKESYEGINRYSNYDRVWQNLRDTINLRNQMQSPLKVYISFVILPDNFQQMAEFIEMGKELGVDRVRFFFDASNLNYDNHELVEAQVSRALAAAQKYQELFPTDGLVNFYKYFCAKTKRQNIHSHLQEVLAEKICPLPWNNLYIDAFGNVYNCCMVNIILGNLHKKPLAEIINNRKALNLRKKMAKQDFSYCLSFCPKNSKPFSGWSFNVLLSYFKSFIIHFKRSPKAAFIKALRKARQLV